MDDERARQRRKTEWLRKRTRWARFRLIFVVGLALTLGISGLIFGARQGGGSTSMDMQVLSVKQHYPEALSVAREWRSDVQLDGVIARFRPATETGKLTIAYGFRSPSDPSGGFLIWVKLEESGLEIVTDDFAYPPDKPVGEPIDPLQLPLDSAEALSIIMQNGGAEFIAQHGMIPWPLGLDLEYRQSYSSEGPLVWTGSFGDRATLDSAYIRIDAYTGELVD